MRNSAGKSSKKDRNRLLAARVPNNRLLGEQMMADIHHVIEENEVASIEEANAFPATLTGTGIRQALRHAAPPSSREQAQQLVFEAMDARTEKQARMLTQLTLALGPDCVGRDCSPRRFALSLAGGADCRPAEGGASRGAHAWA